LLLELFLFSTSSSGRIILGVSITEGVGSGISAASIELDDISKR